ncbi:LysR family transcriptional regulator [Pseudooceanicola sp. 502str34]
MPVGLVPQIQQTAALRYFYEVAQHGSFRAAGEVLHIAPSAVNRQIKLLEEELGTTLFDRARGRNACKLTAVGEALLYRVNRAMRELTIARDELNAFQGLQRGRVALGMNDTIGREFGVGFIAEFRAEHPAVSIEVMSGNSPQLLELLLTDQVDIILALGVAARREIEVVSSSQTHLCVMMRADHPLAQQDSVSLSDAVRETLILPSQGIILRQVVDTMLAAQGLEMTPGIVSNSFELMADMVEAGLGFGVQVRRHPGPDLVRPRLTHVAIREAPPSAGMLACCVRRDRVPTAAMSQCLRLIQDRLQDQIGG